MDSFKKLKIGTQLSLGFGMLTALMLVLAVFSVLRVSSLATAFHEDSRITAERLEPLYVAREALDQTGLAARNAYIFTDDAEATKELAIVDEQKAIYLTGSHIWNNFQDGMGPGPACNGTPEQFDFDGYLKFLKEHGHNFIRLWRWELFKSQAAGGGYHLCMTPQPWQRTGPGEAKDGQPKFDLEKFDQAFFDRS